MGRSLRREARLAPRCHSDGDAATEGNHKFNTLGPLGNEFNTCQIQGSYAMAVKNAPSNYDDHCTVVVAIEGAFLFRGPSVGLEGAPGRFSGGPCCVHNCDDHAQGPSKAEMPLSMSPPTCARLGSEGRTKILSWEDCRGRAQAGWAGVRTAGPGAR